ncbi:hypothetical protein ACFE04_020575 [Oxalis oulophora]
MSTRMEMPSAKALVSTAASLAASAMVIRTISRELLPPELRTLTITFIRNILKYFSSEVQLLIEENDGLGGNQIYKAAEIYLATKLSPSTRLYRVTLPVKENKISVLMAKNQEIVDIFDGVKLKWRQVTRTSEVNQMQYSGHSMRTEMEIRSYCLTFDRKYKDKVIDCYLPFILSKANNLEHETKALKIHTLRADHHHGYEGNDMWSGVILDHPATFGTMAMDSELKLTVMEDLERFVKRKEYYKRVGKAWKRGYLLYGPPGTGKSSLIAAMANYLNFDIYDLQLSDISHNSFLRKILISTKNRSILVIEDIDCSAEAQDRLAEPRPLEGIIHTESQVLTQLHTNAAKPKREKKTLSGLLNFIDGLWSSCGDERIIIFTTNHKERLDPALLRPGRMDMHIHMSYCTPCGFTTLANNYLGLTDDDHPLIGKIKELIQNVMVTPAEVGEQLLKNDDDDPDQALQNVIKFLLAKEKAPYTKLE